VKAALALARRKSENELFDESESSKISMEIATFKYPMKQSVFHM
jgi:hypothetical protein